MSQETIAPDCMRLGKRIRAIRARSNITQELLAKWVKTTQPHLSLIEQGKVEIKLPMLVRIASALNVSVSELVRH
jgi:transcriptional regulator with XRE-family HTH domain